jgi:glutathione S-transferase
LAVSIEVVLTLYHAPACPFCARTRILLDEKGVDYESVEIDLADRPAWLYEKNPTGSVPVIEDDGFVLSESPVINEYVEERWPEPPLLPADPAARALVRLAIERFALGGPFYAAFTGQPDGSERLAAAVADLDARLAGTAYVAGDAYTLADVSYVPWLLRARAVLAFDLDPYPHVLAWLERVLERPAVAAEAAVVEPAPA